MVKQLIEGYFVTGKKVIVQRGYQPNANPKDSTAKPVPPKATSAVTQTKKAS